MSYNFSELSFFILIIFVLAWIIQMAYHWILFRRLAFHKKQEKRKDGTETEMGETDEPEDSPVSKVRPVKPKKKSS